MWLPGRVSIKWTAIFKARDIKCGTLLNPVEINPVSDWTGGSADLALALAAAHCLLWINRGVDRFVSPPAGQLPASVSHVVPGGFAVIGRTHHNEDGARLHCRLTDFLDVAPRTSVYQVDRHLQGSRHQMRYAPEPG